MWIVRLALNRPYTFVVVALMMLIFGVSFSSTMSKDIFPNINIPIVSVVWSYAGLPADEFEQRITTYSEYSLSNNVNDIERMESQTLDGVGIIRLFFHPNVEIETAVAQATAVSQAILKRLPAGILPPIILRYYANSVPIIQMILHSTKYNESELYDYGNFRVRQNIATIQGTTLPTPYGGKVRGLMVDVDPEALQAKGLSPRDVNNAIDAQVLTLPTGDSRIGEYDYRVNVNNTPFEADSFNDIPIKIINGTIVYIRDVAHAHDGFVPQVNIVRNDGTRAVLMTILRNGAASTLSIINSVKELLPTIRAAAPKGMEFDLLFDQSIFVKAAIESVVEEGILAAFLTGMMILLFLGSWRSTLIVLVSIPLSILTSIIILGLTGETINVMTLGGLALAIGILVDDATVTIENIHRNFGIQHSLMDAILDGSYQVAVPAFVSTLSICIVFMPVVLLVGPAKFLFTPFALAVVYAILASYFLSRTLVPVMIKFMLPGEMYLYTGGGAQTAFDRYHFRFEEFFDNKIKKRYGLFLRWSLIHRYTVVILFGLVFLSGLLVFPFIGQDFFPTVDANVFRLHVKAKSGIRIEVTEEIFSRVEEEIKKVIPPEEIEMLIDNIGLVAEPYNLALGDNATVGSSDGEILVSLKRDRQFSTQTYVEKVRKHLNEVFPEIIFYFQPADMVSQILNFGLPTPIDVRVVGYDREHNLDIAEKLVEEISHVPGAVDVNLHQVIDFPEIFLDVDRTLLTKIGLTQSNITNDILLSYSSSAVVTPNFWLDRKMGIPYLISVQLPKYRVNSLDALLRMPVSSPVTNQSELLSNLASVKRRSTVGLATHLNIQPVYDIFANVQGRDLGSTINDIKGVTDKYKTELKPGNDIFIQGLATSMQTAFFRLSIGFVLAILLVYLLMVINFQSWLDPLIIISALPGAFAGILWMLYLTGTTFSVPSLMGTIMCIGVATANSILMVTFANFQMREGQSNIESMRLAGLTRLRPVLMTALAMIMGMIPMALSLGEGSEQNAPLGRAVIGGLLVATCTTLFFVPVIYTLLRNKPNPYTQQNLKPNPPQEQQVNSDEK